MANNEALQWQEEMRAALNKRTGGCVATEKREWFLKMLSFYEPTSVANAEEVFRRADETSTISTFIDVTRAALADGLLRYVPILIEEDENGDERDIPVLQLGPSLYLSWFRGYRLQISSNINGEWDQGSSTASMEHDFGNLRHDPKYRNLIIYSHCMQIALQSLNVTTQSLIEAILYTPEVFTKFVQKTHKRSCNNEMPGNVTVQSLVDNMWPLGNDITVLKEFPMLARSKDGTPQYVGKFVVGIGAIGYQRYGSDAIVGYSVKDLDWGVESTALKTMLYICAFNHQLWSSNGNPIKASDEAYAPEMPEDFADYVKSLKSFELYRNLVAVDAYLCSDYEKDKTAPACNE